MRLSPWHAAHAADIVLKAWRPPKASDRTLRRIVVRRVKVLLVVVPVGLALSAFLAYFPEHPLSRLVRRLGAPDEPTSG